LMQSLNAVQRTARSIITKLDAQLGVADPHLAIAA
jgi:hypothetical protein